jgi:hypothetical protein
MDWIAISVRTDAHSKDVSNSVSRYLVGSVALNAALLFFVLSGFLPNLVPNWAREAQLRASLSQVSN